MREISADAADMPVNPRSPAIIDTTKKTSAHLNSVIACSSSLRVFHACSKSLVQLPATKLVPTRGLAAIGPFSARYRAKMPLLNQVPGGNITTAHPTGGT